MRERFDSGLSKKQLKAARRAVRKAELQDELAELFKEPIQTRAVQPEPIKTREESVLDRVSTTEEVKIFKEAVDEFTQRLRRFEPSKRIILDEAFELFGTPKEVLSPLDFTWPKKILDEKHELFGAPKEIFSNDYFSFPRIILPPEAELFGTPREVLSNEEFILPLSEEEVQRMELLQREEQEAVELIQLQKEFRGLGANMILHGPIKGPMMKKLRAKEFALDKAIVFKDEPYRIACLEAYAEGLGVIQEDVAGVQVKYLRILYNRKDLSIEIFEKIRGNNGITPAACIFLWGKTRYMSREKTKRLEGFLLEPENAQRIRRNVEISSEIKVVGDDNPSGMTAVSLVSLIPVYANWMSKEFVATEHS